MIQGAKPSGKDLVELSLTASMKREMWRGSPWILGASLPRGYVITGVFGGARGRLVHDENILRIMLFRLDLSDRTHMFRV